MVNELTLPVNRPIAFKITSNTVMNSFFIPRLGGQIYAMAGMETQLHVIADKPGRKKRHLCREVRYDHTRKPNSKPPTTASSAKADMG